MSSPGSNLFAGLLGNAYAGLPDAVRALHERALPAAFRGEVEIEVARHALTRLLGRIVGLPGRSGKFPLVFEIDGTPQRQRWIRHFPPRPMRSVLSARAGLLHERMGPASLEFRLHGDGDGIVWELIAVRALGLPLPLRWFRGIRARESGDDDRYRFDVSAALPLLGHLVSYRGWLDVGPDTM